LDTRKGISKTQSSSQFLAIRPQNLPFIGQGFIYGPQQGTIGSPANLTNAGEISPWKTKSKRSKASLPSIPGFCRRPSGFFFYMGPGYVMHQKWREKRRKRIIVGDLNVQKCKKERDRRQQARQSSAGAGG